MEDWAVSLQLGISPLPLARLPLGTGLAQSHGGMVRGDPRGAGDGQGHVFQHQLPVQGE